MVAPAPARPIVLIVDDIADIRLAYRYLLEADQFEVVEAVTAASALHYMAERKVDVVLTDLYMPGELDGIDLVQIIRRRPGPRPAIIAMSGSPHVAYRSSLQTARFVGADATFRKPIARADLIDTIRGLLGGGATPLPSLA